MRVIIQLVTGFVCLMILGCGQTGKLYLPDSPPPHSMHLDKAP